MQTIGINSNNDIYIDSSGNLAIKQDREAIGDVLINKCQTNQGELLFNTEKGIDFFNTIFGSPAYVDLFQNQLITEIENTESVQKINDYNANLDKNVYKYTVDVQTDYGSVSLNG